MNPEMSRIVDLLDSFLKHELKPFEFRNKVEKLLNEGLPNKLSDCEWNSVSGFIQKVDSFSPDLPVATTFLTRISRTWKSTNGEFAYSEEGLRREAQDFRDELTGQLSPLRKISRWFRLPK
jgi:hypothetical protein